MRELSFSNDGAASVEQAGLVPFRSPINTSKPKRIFLTIVRSPGTSHGPSRRLPIPVLALNGATSY
jgi:hypothetical protein